MPGRLHFGGRTRRWLGRIVLGDEELGERLVRRGYHALGALVLVYFLLPPRFFIVLPPEAVLLLALAVVLSLEALRHAFGLELPTIRPHETHRVASFAYYAVALVAAVLLFPVPIATFAVLGTAFLDPLCGELRASATWARWTHVLPFVLYVGLAVAVLLEVGRFGPVGALAVAVVAAAVAMAVEGRHVPALDDDLLMTLGPAAVALGLVVALPSLPGWGA